MNTNNKEDAIGEIEFVIEVIKKDFPRCAVFLQKAVDLLQDNEDTEVQDRPTCPHTVTDLGMSSECVLLHDKPQFKPSSKVEKLKELQGRFSTNLDYGAQWADLVKILNVLIEDEE